MNTAEAVQMSQYLTFHLGSDMFAIDVTNAKEILDYANLTQVPQTPDYMLGVINLRGSVVPVIDMRLKFGLPQVEKTKDSCFIVVEVLVNGEVLTVGTLVDSVSEVVDIKTDQIEPPPRLGTSLNTSFIKGMGNLGDNFVIILDINKVFSAEELDLVNAIGQVEEEAEEVTA